MGRATISAHDSLTRVSKGSFHRILESFPPFRKRGETIGERGDDASIETKGPFLFGYVSSTDPPHPLTRTPIASIRVYARPRTPRREHARATLFLFFEVYFFTFFFFFSFFPFNFLQVRIKIGEEMRSRTNLDFIFNASFSAPLSFHFHEK